MRRTLVIIWTSLKKERHPNSLIRLYRQKLKKKMIDIEEKGECIQTLSLDNLVNDCSLITRYKNAEKTGKFILIECYLN